MVSQPRVDLLMSFLLNGFVTIIFLACIPKHRPVILLMDGHLSHYCPETIHMAAKERVVLCTLTSHHKFDI